MKAVGNELDYPRLNEDDVEESVLRRSDEITNDEQQHRRHLVHTCE